MLAGLKRWAYSLSSLVRAVPRLKGTVFAHSYASTILLPNVVLLRL